MGNWSNPDQAVVHMYHSGLWGGWQYQVSGVQQESATVQFGYGGYQEARGSRINSNHFYIENLLEELDVPGEWYYNGSTSTLYYFPNASTVERPALPVLDTLIEIKGQPDQPVANITILGLELTETRSTFLQQYEVPSGGDWWVLAMSVCWCLAFVGEVGCSRRFKAHNAAMTLV